MLDFLQALSAATLMLTAQAAPLSSADAGAGAPMATSAAPPMPDTALGNGVANKDRIECRSVRRTGSRFPIRECMTPTERLARAEAARKNKDEIQRRGYDRKSR